MVKSLLEIKGWRRELLIVYLIAFAFPVALAYHKRHQSIYTESGKNITFEKLLSQYKPPDGSKTYRPQYLVNTKDTRRIFDVPLLRGLPENKP